MGGNGCQVLRLLLLKPPLTPRLKRLCPWRAPWGVLLSFIHNIVVSVSTVVLFTSILTAAGRQTAPQLSFNLYTLRHDFHPPRSDSAGTVLERFSNQARRQSARKSVQRYEATRHQQVRPCLSTPLTL